MLSNGDAFANSDVSYLDQILLISGLDLNVQLQLLINCNKEQHWSESMKTNDYRLELHSQEYQMQREAGENIARCTRAWRRFGSQRQAGKIVHVRGARYAAEVPNSKGIVGSTHREIR